MKVQFTSKMKEIVTVAEMPAVHKVIEIMKGDSMSLREYAEMAARLASGCNNAKILEVTAEVAKNCMVWDKIWDGTKDFDVWIKFTAYTGDGFVIGGAYLTDIWGYNEDNREEKLHRMYVRRFVEVA